jgi:hypothetical protein
MKLNIAKVALLVGMVFANNAQAKIIFGNSCIVIPPTVGPPPTPRRIECESVIIRVEFDQFLQPPPGVDPPPGCARCAFAEIVDIPGLDLLNVKVPIEFAVASRLESDDDLPLFAVDNPQIPNLLLTYVGNQTIPGPTNIGFLELTVDDWPEEIAELKYHARAFDVNQQLVVNTGSIAIVSASPVPSLSLLAITLLGILMGIGGYRRLHT